MYIKGIEKFETNKDLTPILPHLEKAAKILGIDIPPIKVVPYIFNKFGFKMIGATYDPTVPLELYHGAWNCQPEENLIILGENYVVHDLMKCRPDRHLMEAKYWPRKVPDGMLLFTLLHELRHSWQLQKRPEKYYSGPNAVTTTEHFCDPSEVDADAFAKVFIQKYTSVDLKDFFFMTERYFSEDGGLRNKRVKQLQKSLVK